LTMNRRKWGRERAGTLSQQDEKRKANAQKKTVGARGCKKKNKSRRENETLSLNIVGKKLLVWEFM